MSVHSQRLVPALWRASYDHKYLAKLDRRATLSFRWPTDIEAEVFVDAVDEPEIVEPGDELLGARATTVFRGLVARVNSLAQDRGDLHFAAKECSRNTSAPRVRDMKGIKRIG